MNVWNLILLKLKGLYETHIANADAHHVKYTDANAVTAINNNTVGCNWSLIVAQSIPPTVWTKIQFDNKRWDIDDNYNTGNNRFIAPKTGYYQLNVNTAIKSLVATKKFLLAIRINDTPVAVGRLMGDNAAWGIGMAVATTAHLSTNDFVEMFVYHDDTVPRNLAPEVGYTGFSTMLLSQ